jgi:Fes/CIP4 homology domain.
MSYAEKLFDNLPLANQHVLQGKKAVEELLLFFKSIVAVDENYAKSIENLSNFQFLLLKGSMHEAALALKHDIQNKATQLRAFIDNMTQDIIKPLQSILNTLVEQAKSLSSEAQKTVKMKEKYFDKLNRYKEKF